MDITGVTAATYRLAVIMERTALASPWQPYRWEAKGVVRDIFEPAADGRMMLRDEQLLQMLYPGFELKLQRDEAEGYYLNLTSPAPKVFVLWGLVGEYARPQFVTVSYNEGARWMDSAEHVDGVPLPMELQSWLGAYVNENYRPAPQQKKRYASNRDKGRMGGV